MALWPYGVQQLETAVAILDRFKKWKSIVEDLAGFFSAIQGLEGASAREHRRRCVLVDAGPNITAALQGSLRAMAEEHSMCEKILGDSIAKRLLNMKHEILKNLRRYKNDLDKQFSVIAKIRNETVASIATHEKIHRAQLNITTNGLDPWLTERILYRQLHEMVQAENRFQDNVKMLIAEIQEFDRTVVVELKRIFEEYSHIRTRALTTLNNQMCQTTTLVEQIDPTAPFKGFSEKNFNFLESSIWDRERKIDDFPYLSSEVKIVKQGIMFRPGRIVKTAWKPALFVLTDSSWIHCFSEFRPGESSESLDAEEQRAVYQNLTKATTHFSVCLSRPRVTVQRVESKSSLSIFELVVHKKRKPKHLFSATESVMRYEIKANNEEEAEEWVSLLQRTIESCIPDGPPKPLFRSPTELIDFTRRGKSEHPFEHAGESQRTINANIPPATKDGQPSADPVDGSESIYHSRACTELANPEHGDDHMLGLRQLKAIQSVPVIYSHGIAAAAKD
ncbi:uncharacterized protein BJ171DRAFT_497471 [Polychytrium aggregatum]|uniref:uncharacterized protein n=1 Tax=Polychytrium aggregatum TaxID=110093 RepID=UPI0022FED9A4|nr:uncharacterized protein BJ171DRAFT_497471 [Polychytrium aggregatum]KAI9206372.1 hypothetical protein BJ171DRAFT_497471 [Polychytrium aggregatum]